MIWAPPIVRFWTQKTEKCKLIRRSNICFAPISGSFEQGLFLINYVIPIESKVLTDKQIKFYLKFVSSILDKSRFKYRHFRFKKTKTRSYLHLSLNTKGMTYKQALLYLTFFRYLHEFSELVIDFCDNSQEIKGDSELFDSFIKTSINAVNGKINYGYFNLGGHGLICSANIKIKLDKFKENLKNNNLTTVHSFFY